MTNNATVFNGQVHETGYGVLIQNSAIFGEVVNAMSRKMSGRCFPYAHCVRPSTNLIRISSTSVIAFLRPSSFETLFWFIATMTLTWPFQSRVWVAFGTTYRQALLDCHIFARFKILRKYTILLIIK